MKRRRAPWLLLGLLILMASGLAGCMSINPDDSDQPWNVPSPNDGVPTLPGMNP
jgi:hypothetical protein